MMGVPNAAAVPPPRQRRGDQQAPSLLAVGTSGLLARLTTPAEIGFLVRPLRTATEQLVDPDPNGSRDDPIHLSLPQRTVPETLQCIGNTKPTTKS
jgi:hypothetical protein